MQRFKYSLACSVITLMIGAASVGAFVLSTPKSSVKPSLTKLNADTTKYQNNLQTVVDTKHNKQGIKSRKVEIVKVAMNESRTSNQLATHNQGVRFATISDIPSIQKLISKHGDGNLHHRSLEFFREMIEANFSVVMYEDNVIVGYIEVCFLFSKSERKMYSKKLLGGPNSLCQVSLLPGDVLLYVAGALRDPSRPCTRSLIVKALQFSAIHFGLYDLRKTQKDSCRIIVASGHLNDISKLQSMNKLATRGLKKFIPSEQMTRFKAFPHPMPGNNNLIGSLVFRIYDKPLTAHQLERTKRNRYLISEEEQRTLLNCRIGIVGLSTGSVALEALLRQGVGGVYRLADFDEYEVSNGNRMLFSKADVGRSKLELCKERVKMCDPNVAVEEFPKGLSKENVSDFVADCDIIIEECDDFLVKFLVRKEAMKYKKPVLMATSQNGMVDIERYDVDNNILPFHVDNIEELEPFMENNLTAEAKAEMLSKLFVLEMKHYNQ